MIARLTGRVIDEEGDRLILDVGGVGYEVIVPPHQMKALRARHLPADDPKARLSTHPESVSLFIHYHVPERKPVPVMYGFNDALERRFFEMLAGVSRFGPMAAAKSMTISVPEYASRIMTRDVKALTALPGIGAGKAEQLIAALRGKMALFAMMPEEKLPERALEPAEEWVVQAQIALEDLGYRSHEAEQMLRAAREAKPQADTLEKLLDAVWTQHRDRK
ncbi:MAG: Holliday junction branch migration protein RuvA [Armatimonadota bacterium]